MIKKILGSLFLAVIFGLLILGGINRTIAKTVQSEPLDLANADDQTLEVEWLTKRGSIKSVNEDLWVVTVSDGETLQLTGRMIRYLADQGFNVAVNDWLTIVGFLEGGAFEVGRIENETTGQTISIRDESGHPLWSGNRYSRQIIPLQSLPPLGWAVHLKNEQPNLFNISFWPSDSLSPHQN